MREVSVVYQDDPYGQGMAGVVTSHLSRIASPIRVRSIPYPLRGDVSRHVQKLAEGRPQLTIVVGLVVPRRAL